MCIYIYIYILNFLSKTMAETKTGFEKTYERYKYSSLL